MGCREYNFKHVLPCRFFDFSLEGNYYAKPQTAVTALMLNFNQLMRNNIHVLRYHLHLQEQQEVIDTCE
jgi:hypothetical protein